MVTESCALLSHSDRRGLSYQWNAPKNTLTSSRGESSVGFMAMVFLTVNASLGAGLLNVPYAFDRAGGMISSTLVHLIHVALISLSLLVLTCGCRVSGRDSLQAIVGHFCGPTWAHLCSASVGLYTYGACVTYVIIIGDQFDKVFSTFCPDVYNQHWYFSGTSLMIYILLFAILPLCFFRDISFLKFSSFFGFLSTLYLTVLVFVQYLNLGDEIERQEIKVLKPTTGGPKQWIDSMSVIPMLTFAYNCQPSWVPACAELRRDTSYVRIVGMILVSMLICFFSYTWTALFGVLTFVETGPVAKNIMTAYDPTDPFVSIGMLLLVVKTIALYPVLLYSGRTVIEELVPIDSSLKGRVVIATTWVLSSCALALAVPDIAVAISYLGSVGILFVFILPGLTFLYAALEEGAMLATIQVDLGLRPYGTVKAKWIVVAMAILLIGYGAFAMVISICQTFHY